MDNYIDLSHMFEECSSLLSVSFDKNENSQESSIEPIENNNTFNSLQSSNSNKSESINYLESEVNNSFISEPLSSIENKNSNNNTINTKKKYKQYK